MNLLILKENINPLTLRKAQIPLNAKHNGLQQLRDLKEQTLNIVSESQQNAFCAKNSISI